MWYFEEGSAFLWRGWCGTLKSVVWYFENGSVILWRVWYGTLKRVVCYFEEGGVVIVIKPIWIIVWYSYIKYHLYLRLKYLIDVSKVSTYQCRLVHRFKIVLWRGWYGTLKSVVWYFEEGGVVLWRGWCGTLKRVVWYFEEGSVVLWRGWRGTLKRVVCYFEEGGYESYTTNFEESLDENAKNLPDTILHIYLYLFIFFYFYVYIVSLWQMNTLFKADLVSEGVKSDNTVFTWTHYTLILLTGDNQSWFGFRRC